MKEGIHPKYFPHAKVTCSCGNTWTTGSTRESIRTDVCYKCHPFYTGEQRIVDTEGQVERFVKKLDARATHKKKEEERQAQRQSPTVALVDLNLGARAEAALSKAGIITVGQILEKLEQGGDQALLDVDGFGHKNLADTKKRLRARGFDLPADAATEGEGAAASESAEA